MNNSYKHLIIALNLFLVLNNCALAISQERTIETRLKVRVGSAAVHLKPDNESPVIGSLGRGTVIKSYKSEGGWYRVVFAPEKDLISMIGYVIASDVDILDEKDLSLSNPWKPSAESFRGIGLSVQLGVGISFFPGGDLSTGTRGMYNDLAASISNMGFPLSDKYFLDLKSAADISADIEVQVGPRIFLGIGGDYISAHRIDKIGFSEHGIYRTATSVPTIVLYAVRPSVYYRIPFSRMFHFILGGGPAVYFSTYEYCRTLGTSLLEETFRQSARNTIFGAQAAAGFQVYLNNRTALVLQAIGRYARGSNLKGEEEYDRIYNTLDVSLQDYQGTLLLVQGETYPRLAIGPVEGAQRKKALFDFSGINLSLGLRIDF